MTLTALIVPPGKGIIASAIAKIDGTPYDHVCMDLGDGYVSSEEMKGLTLWPNDRYTNPEIIRWELPLSPVQAEVARQWLRNRTGMGYDYAQFFVDLINVEFHTTLADQSQDYVCSGACAAAVKAAGWYPFGTLSPHVIRPSHWYMAYKEATKK